MGMGGIDGGVGGVPVKGEGPEVAVHRRKSTLIGKAFRSTVRAETLGGEEGDG